MRTIISVFAFAISAMAADRPMAVPPEGKSADQKVAIEAKAYFERDQITKLLGIDPGENIVVLEVKMTPLGGETINVNRDDFLLRSDRDGQTARPMEPTQLAGSSVMIISSKGGDQGQMRSQERRVPYGVPGIPGSGGPPMTLPGNQPPVVGSGTSDTSVASAEIKDGGGAGQDKALLEALKQKVLADGETAKPVSGLLYFFFEGKKHRPKDIELVYRKSPPRVHTKFVDPTKKK